MTTTVQHDTTRTADPHMQNACPWCGLTTDCPDPAQHAHLDRISETTWRRAAVTR